MNFPAGFDPALAAEAAGLIDQAYAQFAKFKSGARWNLDAGYAAVTEISAKPAGILAKTEPFGFIARNKTTGNVFAVFRGTASPQDWLSNAVFQQTNFQQINPNDSAWGRVDLGFWKIYQQCSAALMNGTKAASGTAVYVTGHSLGGALATLAAADLAGAGATVTLCTFASPRVGDPAFSARLNAAVPASWRLANTEDIVPALPLASAKLSTPFMPRNVFGAALALANKLDFEHVGTPICFTKHLGSIAGNHSIATYAAALAGK